ncbi:hypothetical protein N7530_002407 [Penicillium desertorum]|uniref:DUF6570 domain-containing protein n=1 Tax=Penicillium desertorum TaxID=1303715 RepID=A0A9X0BT70_9EURO|nr:hypothetical protein N7530_002407 [Penicillium desertorum]
MTSNASKRSVCASCGKLVPDADIFPVHDVDPLLLPLRDALDRCARRERIWNVCLPYHKALIRGTIPKFSARSLVNVTLCQDYPSVLNDLTLTKKCVIARRHPLGVDVKLRPGGQRSSISYRALRGHLIVITQNPGSWCDEFIPPELQDNIIQLDQSDHQEREGYTVDLAQGNYENDLQAAQNESVDSNDCGPFLTGPVFTDINGERQNSDLRMLHESLSRWLGRRRTEASLFG